MLKKELTRVFRGDPLSNDFLDLTRSVVSYVLGRHNIYPVKAEAKKVGKGVEVEIQGLKNNSLDFNPYLTQRLWRAMLDVSLGMPAPAAAKLHEVEEEDLILVQDVLPEEEKKALFQEAVASECTYDYPDPKVEENVVISLIPRLHRMARKLDFATSARHADPAIDREDIVGDLIVEILRVCKLYDRFDEQNLKHKATTAASRVLIKMIGQKTSGDRRRNELDIPGTLAATGTEILRRKHGYFLPVCPICQEKSAFITFRGKLRCRNDRCSAARGISPKQWEKELSVECHYVHTTGQLPPEASSEEPLPDERLAVQEAEALLSRDPIVSSYLRIIHGEYPDFEEWLFLNFDMSSEKLEEDSLRKMALNYLQVPIESLREKAVEILRLK